MFIAKLKGVVGIEENNGENTIRVYPNLTAGMVNVQCSVNGNTLTQSPIIEVYNMYGAKVYSNEAVNIQPNASSTIQIDLSDYPDGIYFVNVVTEKGTAVKKLIKE